MAKNYTVEKKNIELTEQGKQQLVDWAINYYDEQNQEPEAIDIVDVNIPVGQQQMETVLKKLKKTIEIMDKKLGLTESLEEERLKKYSKGDGIINTMAATSISTVFLFNIAGLISFNVSFTMLGLGAAAINVAASLLLILKASSHPSTKHALKAKLDKHQIKKDKKAKKAGVDLDIEFSEDEYTLLFLEKLYNELFAQNESNKKILEAGV